MIKLYITSLYKIFNSITINRAVTLLIMKIVIRDVYFRLHKGCREAVWQISKTASFCLGDLLERLGEKTCKMSLQVIREG